MSKDNFQCDSLPQDTVVADLGIVGLINFGPYRSSTLLRTLEFCNLARIQPQTRASSSTGSEIDHLRRPVELEDTLMSDINRVRPSGGKSVEPSQYV